MTCEEVRHLIVETLSGTAVPDQRRIVEAHLAGCASCRADAAWVEETVAALRVLPETRLRDDLWDGFMRDLDARLASEQRRPWARLRRGFRSPRHAWVGAAAAAALALGLGTALVMPGRFPGAADVIPGDGASQVMETTGLATVSPAMVSPAMVSPQVVEGLPAMDASLAVWRAGLGAGGVTYDLTGGR